MTASSSVRYVMVQFDRLPEVHIFIKMIKVSHGTGPVYRVIENKNEIN